MFGPYDELQLAVNETNKLFQDIEAEVFSGADAAEMVTELARHRSITDALIGRFQVRVADTNAHRSSGHAKAESFVAQASGITAAQAARQLQTARKLSELPKVADAFRSGDISSTQAELIAQAATSPKTESSLLNTALTQTTAVLSEEARRVKAAKSAEAEAADDHRRRELRMCRFSAREDGMASLYAYGPIEAMAKWKGQLERRRDRIFRDKCSRGVRDSFEQNTFDALVEVFEGATPHSGTSADKSSSKSRKVRKVDATVVIDATALMRGYRDGGETCEVAGLGTVSVAAALDLMNESMFRILVTDGINVKTVTSRSRYWPKTVEAALKRRDERCCIVGCDVRDRLQKHHDEMFSRAGPTNYENGRRICADHHRMITYEGYVMYGEPGNWRLRAPGQMELDDG